MRGIPAGTPDYLRAQDIAMVSKTELKKDKKGKRDETTRGSSLGFGDRGGNRRLGVDRRRAALRGAAARQQQDRPAGTARRTRKSSSKRPMRCATANMRRPSPASRRSSKRRSRSSWKGAEKARRRAGRVLRLCLPLLQGEQPARRPADPGEPGPARGLPRTSDPRARTASGCRPSLARGVQGRPVPAVPRRALRRRPARAGHAMRPPPAVANISPQTERGPSGREPSSRRTSQLAGQLGATGTPSFVVGDRVLNGAVGYATLKKAVEDAQKRELRPELRQALAMTAESRCRMRATADGGSVGELQP